jgi:diguanylate cyclase (GGDEF)-like protein
MSLTSQRIQIRQEQAALFAASGRFQQAYEEYQRFHLEGEMIRAKEREARAQALHVMYETHEARRASSRFQQLALRDALTELPNRRFVDETLPTLVAQAAERSMPLSTVLIDLDYFKRINDTLSHDAGDAVLIEVGRLLAAAVCEPGFAARLGGEEFLLVLPDTPHAEAIRLCEQFRRAVQSHDWRPITGDLPVTASLGVATSSPQGTTSAALLSQADRNMYAAKRSGRNRVVGDPT